MSITDLLGVPIGLLTDQYPIMFSGVQTQDKKHCSKPKQEENRKKV